MRATLVVLVFMSCVNSAFGQSVADIEMKYGKPTNVYSVSEHIWMAPEYAVDGQVCRMRLYPKRIAGDVNYLSQKLPFEELRSILNALVPINKRGAKKVGFGLTDTGVPAAWTTYAYEKVTFTFVSSFSPVGFVGSPPPSLGDYVSPTQGLRNGQGPESSVPSDDDFRDGQTSATEIVTVRWNDRKCGGQ